MPIESQLSVFLENKPGALGRLLQSFAHAKINICAIMVSDTVDHAVVRMLVSDSTRAQHLLEQHGVLVVETEVLTLKVPNQPGALARIAATLAKGKVNIEYAYGTAGLSLQNSLLILRVNNLAKARKLLKV